MTYLRPPSEPEAEWGASRFCIAASRHPKNQGMNRNGREFQWVELQPELCLRSCPIFSQVVISQAGCGLWQGTLRRAAPVLGYHWSLTVHILWDFHLSESLLDKQKKGPKLPHTYNISNSNIFPFSLLLFNNFLKRQEMHPRNRLF